MKLVEKTLRPADLKRLRGEAAPTTHLARYEAANNAGVGCVLDVPCIDCGAPTRKACFEGS